MKIKRLERNTRPPLTIREEWKHHRWKRVITPHFTRLMRGLVNQDLIDRFSDANNMPL